MMHPSPENRLLVTCVQAGISETAANEVKEILKLSLQWEEFLKSVSWQGVAPLVYGNLKDIPEGCLIPPQVMDQLKEAYYATLVRNMLLYSELEIILKSFHEEGIEVILLKGAALAKTVYADIGMRPMGDIDILVRREDLPRAEGKLSLLGYGFHGGTSPEWWRANHYHIGFRHPEKTVPVELHWHVTNEMNPLRIRDLNSDMIEGFWQRAERRAMFGDNVLMLSPEDSLLYLSIHFLKHRFYNSKNGGFTSRGALMQLCDMLYTQNDSGNAIDWKSLGQEAEQQNIHTLCDLVLRLIVNIMGEGKDSSSAVVREQKSADSDQEILELMTKKIFIREETRPYVSGTIITALSGNTFRGVAGELLRDIFLPREFISNRYSVPLSSKKLSFYYFKRLVDLLLKHRGIISEIPRLRDDVVLNRWMHSRGSAFAHPLRSED